MFNLMCSDSDVFNLMCSISDVFNLLHLRLTLELSRWAYRLFSLTPFL